jgi:hypothetical protein
MTRTKQLHVDRYEQAFQSNLRTTAIIDLASLAGTDTFESRLDGDIEDLVDQLLDDYEKHPSIKDLEAAVRDVSDEGDDQLDMLGEILGHRELLGFAVRFSTPVMTRSGKTSWSFSWGYTQSTWVYADTYEQAWKLGVEWADKLRAEAKPAKKERARV